MLAYSENTLLNILAIVIGFVVVLYFVLREKPEKKPDSPKPKKDKPEVSALGDTGILAGPELDLSKDEQLNSSGEKDKLDESEENVNLDSFGSGSGLLDLSLGDSSAADIPLSKDTSDDSGLLDLSLQADDTSLGGILDEIYTPEDSDLRLDDLDDMDVVLEAKPDDKLDVDIAEMLKKEEPSPVINTVDDEEVLLAEESEKKQEKPEFNVPEDCVKILSITYLDVNGKVKAKTFDE